MHRAGFFLFFSLILTGTIALGQHDKLAADPGRNVRHYLAASEKLLPTDLDSALFYALAAEKCLPRLDSVELKAAVLFRLGDIYLSKGDHAAALTCYLRSKTLIDAALPQQPRLRLLKADMLTRTGTLYLHQRRYKKSLSYYEQALGILEKTHSGTTKAEVLLRRLKVYNNMAAVFIQQSDFDPALVYFRNALELNQTVRDPRYEGSLLNNIGICYLEKKELDLASHYFQQSLKIRKQTSDLQGQAQVLNNIGKNEVFKGNFGLAGTYFRESLALSQQTGNNESMLISLESLSSVSDTLGNYREALRYYKAYKALNDRMFNLESKMAIASLEEKHQRENERKLYALTLKQKESDRLKARFGNLVLVSVLGLLLLVALLLIIGMRGRIRNGRLQQEKLTLERENLELKQSELEESLEFREKELTAKALFLMKNDELITRITENLLKAKATFTRENQQLIQEIIRELRSGRQHNGWDEFEVHFTRVHARFYESLRERFPALTSNEKKLCAFLRLNMSTKDISAITNQSVNSITVARTRLRKKLGIGGEDVDLIHFLMSLQ